MKFIRIVTVIAVATLFSTPLYAQDKTAAAPSTDKQTMRDDCAKQHGKMHDHAKEKGAGDGMVAKCMNEKKGAKSAAKKPLHDHNKEHKNQ